VKRQNGKLQKRAPQRCNVHCEDCGQQLSWRIVHWFATRCEACAIEHKQRTYETKGDELAAQMEAGENPWL